MLQAVPKGDAVEGLARVKLVDFRANVKARRTGHVGLEFRAADLPARFVRRPQEAFEMPLDYDAAPASTAAISGGSIDRSAVISAVERFLAARGIALAPAPVPSGPSCGCSSSAAPASAPQVTESTIANITAEVVSRLLAQRGGKDSPGGYG